MSLRGHCKKLSEQCPAETGSEGQDQSGDILLSNIFQVGYACLYGSSIGEIVYLSFCDPVINGDMNINILLGLMISVSSGTVAKRVPVASRFFISRSEIQDKNLDTCVLRQRLLHNSTFA